MDKKFEKKVSFEYIKATDYRVLPVSGVIGGPTAQGDIVVNLYFERGPIPKKVIQGIDDTGNLIESNAKIEIKDSVIRDVIYGLALKPEVARSIGNWLVEQVDQLDSFKKNKVQLASKNEE
jgi:hypothetical protein